MRSELTGWNCSTVRTHVCGEEIKPIAVLIWRHLVILSGADLRFALVHTCASTGMGSHTRAHRYDRAECHTGATNRRWSTPLWLKGECHTGVSNRRWSTPLWLKGECHTGATDRRWSTPLWQSRMSYWGNPESSHSIRQPAMTMEHTGCTAGNTSEQIRLKIEKRSCLFWDVFSSVKINFSSSFFFFHPSFSYRPKMLSDATASGKLE